MQKTFEENIQENLKDFTLQPSDAVWQTVAAQLPEKKRRRVPVWLFLSICITLTISAYFTILHFKYPKKEVTENKTHPSSNNATTKEQTSLINIKKADVSEKTILPKTTTSNPITTVSTGKKNIISNTRVKEKLKNSIQEIVSSNEGEKYVSNDYSINNNQYAAFKNEEKTPTILFNKNTIASTTPIFVKAYPTKIQLMAVLNHPTSLKNNLHKNTLSLTHENKLKKTTHKQWFATLGAGVLSTNRNIFSNSGTPLSDMLANTNPSGVGSLTGNTNQQLSYTNGFNINAGIGFIQPISSKLDYAIAIGYRYLNSTQNKLKHGSVINNFTSTAADSGVQFTNYAHWLQVQTKINYHFRKHTKNNFYATAGLSSALSIHTKWLSINDANTGFELNSQKNNPVLFTAMAGIGFKHLDHWRLEATIDRSLTSVHKNVSNKYYFTQINLQLIHSISKKK